MSDKRLFSLGPRLSACAELVRRDSIMADIGTDHAMLPVYLVHNGICKRAIASDIARKPYEGACAFVKEHGESDRIDVRLGGGLDRISPEEVTDIVIAGMGGELIAQILDAALWVKNEKYNLILQPMSKAAELREWLLTNGFAIESETAVTDSGKLYTIINSCYTGAKKQPTDIEIYAGRLIPCKNDSARMLLKKQAKMLEDKLVGMRHRDAEAGEETEILIKEIIRLSEE